LVIHLLKLLLEFICIILESKSKKLVKEQEIPSGHNPDDYIVERVEYKSHDRRLVPLTITRHKKTKIDGSANLLLYGYGSYGSSMSPKFFFYEIKFD
jgi:oligopeptidase B